MKLISVNPPSAKVGHKCEAKAQERMGKASNRAAHQVRRGEERKLINKIPHCKKVGSKTRIHGPKGVQPGLQNV